MIQDLELAHQFIVYDLVVRTLERDIQQLPVLKTGRLLEKRYLDSLKFAKDELALIKQHMQRVDLKFDQSEKIDDFVTTYTFLQRGYDQTIRYVNNALRNHTMEAIEKLMSK